CILRAAVVASVLDLRLITCERAPRRAVGRGVLLLATFANPARELVGVEMRESAIGNAGERAILERDERAVRPFGRSRRIPGAGLRAYAPRVAAGEEPHDVDMVRRLVVHGPAAPRRVELFR